jgi:hypothetical protein
MVRMSHFILPLEGLLWARRTAAVGSAKHRGRRDLHLYPAPGGWDPGQLGPRSAAPAAPGARRRHWYWARVCATVGPRLRPLRGSPRGGRLLPRDGRGSAPPRPGAAVRERAPGFPTDDVTATGRNRAGNFPAHRSGLPVLTDATRPAGNVGTATPVPQPLGNGSARPSGKPCAVGKCPCGYCFPAPRPGGELPHRAEVPHACALGALVPHGGGEPMRRRLPRVARCAPRGRSPRPGGLLPHNSRRPRNGSSGGHGAGHQNIASWWAPVGFPAARAAAIAASRCWVSAARMAA